MKLVFGKYDFQGSFALLPRAEFTDEEKATGKEAVQVSLSRASGKCIYALSAFDQHDSHAPRWKPDGTAPFGSTAPEATADSYMKRIQADVEAQGVVVSEVLVMHVPSTPPGAYDKGADNGEDWKKYGVN